MCPSVGHLPPPQKKIFADQAPTCAPVAGVVYVPGVHETGRNGSAGGPMTRVWGELFCSLAARIDPSTPGGAWARSFVPSSVPLGTVDCRDLPRRPLRAFLHSEATRVAWMAVFEVQGCQGVGVVLGGPGWRWVALKVRACAVIALRLAGISPPSASVDNRGHPQDLKSISKTMKWS